MKSAKHCALMGSCDSYRILNSDNSMAQIDSRLAKSGFWRIFCTGWSVLMMTVWD